MQDYLNDSLNLNNAYQIQLIPLKQSDQGISTHCFYDIIVLCALGHLQRT